jgi:hypothetical protein
MPFLEAKMRLSNTNRPDVAAYLPPSNYIQNSPEPLSHFA